MKIEEQKTYVIILTPVELEQLITLLEQVNVRNKNIEQWIEDRAKTFLALLRKK